MMSPTCAREWRCLADAGIHIVEALQLRARPVRGGDGAEVRHVPAKFVFGGYIYVYVYIYTYVYIYIYICIIYIYINIYIYIYTI